MSLTAESFGGPIKFAIKPVPRLRVPPAFVQLKVRPFDCIAFKRSDLESIVLLNDLLKKFKLSKLGVFGSVAREEVSNDIDILIEDNVDYRRCQFSR